MIRRSAVAALPLGALLALLTLAACGNATGTSDPSGDAASDPTVSVSSASVSASASAEPTWPASCTNHSMSQLDFGRAPKGWKTPEDAIAHAADSTIPEGTVVVAPGDATSDAVGTLTVWVVDDATNTILASVHLTSVPGGAGGGGFYVDGVERCA